jgi:hypothetical protein
MAHRLAPRDGHRYLSPRVVVSRLLSKFSLVSSSEEDGRCYVRGIIQQLHVIKKMGSISVDSEYLDRLEKAQNGAIYVYFADWDFETAFLSTVVIPGEPLFFHYLSNAHEKAAKSLLMRCAEALEYEIVDL